MLFAVSASLVRGGLMLILLGTSLSKGIWRVCCESLRLQTSNVSIKEGLESGCPCGCDPRLVLSSSLRSSSLALSRNGCISTTRGCTVACGSWTACCSPPAGPALLLLWATGLGKLGMPLSSSFISLFDSFNIRLFRFVRVDSLYPFFFNFKILLRSIIALQCYSEVNQLYVYTYPLPLDPPPRCLIAEHEPSSLCHTAASPGCQLYTWQCIYVSAVLPVRPTPLPLPLCVQLPITWSFQHRPCLPSILGSLE